MCYVEDFGIEQIYVKRSRRDLTMEITATPDQIKSNQTAKNNFKTIRKVTMPNVKAFPAAALISNAAYLGSVLSIALLSTLSVA